MTAFQTYIQHNTVFIPNCGEKYRKSVAIGSAIAESTVSQVVSRGTIKQLLQQWTPEGAQLLLQTRIRVLNDDLEGLFQKWYRHFRPQVSATVYAATSLPRVVMGSQ